MTYFSDVLGVKAFFRFLGKGNDRIFCCTVLEAFLDRHVFAVPREKANQSCFVPSASGLGVFLRPRSPRMQRRLLFCHRSTIWSIGEASVILSEHYRGVMTFRHASKSKKESIWSFITLYTGYIYSESSYHGLVKPSQINGQQIDQK